MGEKVWYEELHLVNLVDTLQILLKMPSLRKILVRDTTHADRGLKQAMPIKAHPLSLIANMFVDRNQFPEHWKGRPKASNNACLLKHNIAHVVFLQEKSRLQPSTSTPNDNSVDLRQTTPNTHVTTKDIVKMKSTYIATQVKTMREQNRANILERKKKFVVRVWIGN
jgi:hypothetical protein